MPECARTFLAVSMLKSSIRKYGCSSSTISPLMLSFGKKSSMLRKDGELMHCKGTKIQTRFYSMTCIVYVYMS